MRPCLGFAFLFFAFAGGTWADDVLLSTPYRVRIVLDAPDAAIEEAVRQALGPACLVEEPADKEIRFTLATSSQGTSVAAQEIDHWLHDEGPLVVRAAADDSLIPAVAAKLAALVFRPRLQVDRRDEMFQATVVGERLDPGILDERVWFRPLIRFHDQQGEWRSTSEIPWTYLSVGGQTGLSRPIQIQSALPQPLPGRLRRGTVVALACPVVAESTRVRLLDAKTRQARPGLQVDIVGHGDRSEREVVTESADSSTEGEADVNAEAKQIKAEAVRVTADRRGEFVTTANQNQLVRLRVFTTTLIADVPLLPGSVLKQDLLLANDIERVELDERLTAIEYQLQELVAQRSMLVARIRADVEAKRWVDVETLLPRLDRLPSASSLTIALNAARVASVDAALARGDRVLASQLRRKAARLEKTLTTFADPDLNDEFRDEVKALRDIDEAARETEVPDSK